MIEHVKSLPHFCALLGALTKPGGAVLVTTLNRTPRSLALAVVAAEYVLRWVPAVAPGRVAGGRVAGGRVSVGCSSSSCRRRGGAVLSARGPPDFSLGNHVCSWAAAACR